MAPDPAALRCFNCKNRCLLSAPKCSAAMSPEEAAQRARAAAQTCHLCKKRCPLDALECSLGQTIHAIKTRPAN